MTEPTEVNRRLTEIRDEVRELKKLLAGGNGDEGALNRITKLEQGQGFIRVCYLWIIGCVAALFWMVLPNYFQNQK